MDQESAGLLANLYFWYSLALVIFFVLAIKFGGKVITAWLDSNIARITADMQQAKALRAEAEALVDSYRRKQQEALQEAEAILSHARHEAENIRTEAAEQTAIMLKRHEQLALEKISLAEAAATRQVRDYAVDLAMQATRELLTAELKAEQQNRLTEEALVELPKKVS